MNAVNYKLKQLLDYLEQNIDPDRVAESELIHKSALQWKNTPRLPVTACYPYPQHQPFEPFPHGQIFDDPEKMLFNQLLYAFDSSIYLSQQIEDDLPITIRPDFGVVLIPSLFGANVEQTEDNPPWIRQDRNTITYEQIINRTEFDFQRGWIGQVVQVYKLYADILKDYPTLGGVTHIVLPDLQGPFDNMELLMGSSVFMDLYTQQEKFLEAMASVTNAQIDLIRYLRKFTTNGTEGFSFQHGFMLKGKILIRNDTSIMISPEMYEQLIAPFDQEILGQFGGGIHSCGNIQHLIESYLSLDSLQCFDFGQSELNDLDLIYGLAKAKKIPLIRMAVSSEDLVNGIASRKFPTGVSLIFRAESVEQAISSIREYKRQNPS